MSIFLHRAGLLNINVGGGGGAATRSVLFTDNFNRANQTLQTSADWTKNTVDDDANISSNVLEGTPAGFPADEYIATVNSISPNNDQYVEFEVATSGGFLEFGGVVARFTDTDNFYGLREEGGDLVLILRVTALGQGALWTYSSDSGSVSPGDVCSLEIVGTTLKVFVNGVEVYQRIDTDHSSGDVGVWFEGPVQIDNFEAGNMV